MGDITPLARGMFRFGDVVSDVSFNFISLHDNHWAARDFLHFPLYLMASITALEVSGEREASIALHINHTDCDAIFLLAFQHNRLLWADVDLFPVVGRGNAPVDRLVQDVIKFLVPDLVAVETQQTFLVLALVDGNHDVRQQIVFPVLEDWPPFYIWHRVRWHRVRVIRLKDTFLD